MYFYIDLDPELGKDVLQLVQCLRLVSNAVSVEMAYEMEKALEHLQSPERAADLVLESLLSNDRYSQYNNTYRIRTATLKGAYIK